MRSFLVEYQSTTWPLLAHVISRYYRTFKGSPSTEAYKLTSAVDSGPLVHRSIDSDRTSECVFFMIITSTNFHMAVHFPTWNTLSVFSHHWVAYI